MADPTREDLAVILSDVWDGPWPESGDSWYRLADAVVARYEEANRG